MSRMRPFSKVASVGERVATVVPVHDIEILKSWFIEWIK